MLQLYNEDGHGHNAEQTLLEVCKSFWDNPGRHKDHEAYSAAAGSCKNCGVVHGTPPYPFVGSRKGLILFSNVDHREKLGKTYSNWCFDFAKLIKRLQLGEVLKGRTFKNPNTDNPIALWMWYVNNEALWDWYCKQNKNNLKGINKVQDNAFSEGTFAA